MGGRGCRGPCSPSPRGFHARPSTGSLYLWSGRFFLFPSFVPLCLFHPQVPLKSQCCSHSAALLGGHSRSFTYCPSSKASWTSQVSLAKSSFHLHIQLPVGNLHLGDKEAASLVLVGDSSAMQAWSLPLSTALSGFGFCTSLELSVGPLPQGPCTRCSLHLELCLPSYLLTPVHPVELSTRPLPLVALLHPVE